jgi:hypothetical protein
VRRVSFLSSESSPFVPGGLYPQLSHWTLLTICDGEASQYGFRLAIIVKAARDSGGQPSISSKSNRAPFSRSSFTTPSSPFSAARDNGV